MGDAAEWEMDRQMAQEDARREVVVQVRLPGAARTYAYRVPDDWQPLAVGDWVAVPANQVSPEGGKGRVESFGRDAYKGVLKELADKLAPQDPWVVRMEAVRTSKEANTIWSTAQEAGVDRERMETLLVVGRKRLEALEEKRRQILRREAELKERWG